MKRRIDKAVNVSHRSAGTRKGKDTLKRELQRNDEKQSKSKSRSKTRTFGYRNNPVLIAQGFKLFSGGIPIEKVYDRLKDEWPGLSLKTLMRICAENEWVKTRGEQTGFAVAALAGNDIAVEQRIVAGEKILKQLEDKVVLTVTEMGRWSEISDQLLFWRGVNPKLKMAPAIQVSGSKKIAALMEAMQSHKVLGPLINKHDADIKEAMTRILEKSEREKSERK